MTNSDIGWSRSPHQAKIWSNDGILLMGPSGTNFRGNLRFIYFHSRNIFENVVCKMAAILSRPQCVNIYSCSFTACSFTPLLYIWVFRCHVPSLLYNAITKCTRQRTMLFTKQYTWGGPLELIQSACFNVIHTCQGAQWCSQLGMDISGFIGLIYGTL